MRGKDLTICHRYPAYGLTSQGLGVSHARPLEPPYNTVNTLKRLFSLMLLLPLTYEMILLMGKPSTHQRKGNNKMATKAKAPKEVIAINSNITTAYASLIESGENNNADAINFILEVGNEMGNGATQKEVKESMKQALQGVNVRPVVLPNHVDSLLTACLIIARFNEEMQDIKATKVLSLAVRVMADKKASGAQKHIESAETFADLDEQTLTKKESQTRDGSIKAKAEVKKLAPSISNEEWVDLSLTFFKGKNPQDLFTKEPKKVEALLGICKTMLNNSTAKAKVSA